MSTIKLEAGKQYKTRDGRIVTQLYFDEDYGVYRGAIIPDRSCVWHKNGRYTTVSSVDSWVDIVEEHRVPQEITLLKGTYGVLCQDSYGCYLPHTPADDQCNSQWTPVRFREVIE